MTVKAIIKETLSSLGWVILFLMLGIGINLIIIAFIVLFSLIHS